MALKAFRTEVRFDWGCARPLRVRAPLGVAEPLAVGSRGGRPPLQAGSRPRAPATSQKPHGSTLPPKPLGKRIHVPDKTYQLPPHGHLGAWLHVAQVILRNSVSHSQPQHSIQRVQIQQHLHNLLEPRLPNLATHIVKILPRNMCKTHSPPKRPLHDNIATGKHRQ